MSESAPPGLTGSLRQFGLTLLAALQTRLALAGLEVEEEIQRLVLVLVLAMAALACAVLGLMVLTFLVVVWFWDTNRVAACALVGLFYFCLAAGLGLRVRHIFATRPAVLEATLEELGKDRAALAAAAARDTQEAA